MNTRNHIVFFKKMSLLLDRKTQEQRKKASKDISGFIDLDAMLDFLLEVFFFSFQRPTWSKSTDISLYVFYMKCDKPYALGWNNYKSLQQNNYVP